MSFSVKGDYFEACNCDVSCPCIWLGPATQEACDVLPVSYTHLTLPTIYSV